MEYTVQPANNPKSSFAAENGAPPPIFASWWARDVVEAPHCTLSATASALLLLLASHANAAHYCTPTVKKLAAGLKVTDRTVQRAKRELALAGLIKVFPGDGSKAPDGYWLAVRGTVPTIHRGDTHVTPSVHRGDTHVTPLIHTGDTGDQSGVTPMSPISRQREVSRKRARVVSLEAPVDKSAEEVSDFGTPEARVVAVPRRLDSDMG